MLIEFLEDVGLITNKHLEIEIIIMSGIRKPKMAERFKEPLMERKIITPFLLFIAHLLIAHRKLTPIP